MITIGEVVFAGGKDEIINPKGWYYLNAKLTRVSSAWWTMTPRSRVVLTNPVFDEVYVYVIWSTEYSSEGKLFGTWPSNTNDAFVARPVISLKSCVSVIRGNGSVYNPYEVSISEACAQAEN